MSRVSKTKKSRTLWVAAGDVSAPWRVPMRRSGQPKSTEDGGSQDEVIDLFGVTGSDHGNESDQDSIGRTRKGEHRGADPISSRKRRPRKRPKIDDHLKFIDTQPVDEGSPDSLIPTPNSDLLQCIHRLASLYWSQRGELRNARREYRLDRQQKRLRKLNIVSPSESSLPEDIDDENESQPSSGASEAQDQRNPQKDMYMALDGSALVAIGMLLQEYVAQLLIPQITSTAEADITEAASQSSTLE